MQTLEERAAAFADGRARGWRKNSEFREERQAIWRQFAVDDIKRAPEHDLDTTAAEVRKRCMAVGRGFVGAKDSRRAPQLSTIRAYLKPIFASLMAEAYRPEHFRTQGK